MMKHVLTNAFTFISTLFLISSCQVAPELSIISPSSIGLSADGRSATITFTANRDWRANCSDSWVSVSPSSGIASEGQASIKVSCEANTTFDDRIATVTINMEEMSKTITIRQPANLGIILPTKVFNLQSGTRSIEVEVQANVQYMISSSVDWIKAAGTKGITSQVFVFNIDENPTYDTREGKITVKPEQTGVSEQVIVVKQAQKDALIVEKTSYDMPYGGGEIEIKVESNITYDVNPNSEWLHYTQTKGLNSSTVCISVDENPTYSAREGRTEITQKDGAIKHTITVKQAGRIAVTSVELDKENLLMYEDDTELLVATVKPDNATDKTVIWSSSNTDLATVDENGKVTALNEGEVIITAKAGEMVAFCRVTILSLAIDLGLPSGLKWGSCNIGSDKPEDVGTFYSWGECEPKETFFSWASYRWGGPADADIKKYNDKDKLWILEPEDDIATLTLGGKWRIPTEAEFAELIDSTNCSWDWVSMNNVNGYKITSKRNGNHIFLPTTGWWDDDYYGKPVLVHSDGQGYYWSSQRWQVAGAFALLFVNEGRHQEIERNAYYRNDAFVIRPVKGDITKATTIEIDKKSIELTEHSSYYLNTTISPTYASVQRVLWESSDNTVATVKNGRVTSVRSGTAVITVTTVDGAVSGSCHVTVRPIEYSKPEKIDLGLPSGTLWASFNLGASRFEDSGVLFAWGELTPKDDYTEANYRWPRDYYNYYGKYCRDGLITLQLEDDAANYTLGTGWRIPTTEQVAELQNEDYCVWTESAINGVSGVMVTSKINGQAIFLPFLRKVLKRYDYEEGNNSLSFSPGHIYWTSDVYNPNPDYSYPTWCTSFYSGGFSFSSRTVGGVIRPVFVSQ